MRSAAVGMITITVISISARKAGSNSATASVSVTAAPDCTITSRGSSMAAAPKRRTARAPPPATISPVSAKPSGEYQLPTPVAQYSASIAASSR